MKKNNMLPEKTAKKSKEKATKKTVKSETKKEKVKKADKKEKTEEKEKKVWPLLLVLGLLFLVLILGTTAWGNIFSSNYFATVHDTIMNKWQIGGFKIVEKLFGGLDAFGTWTSSTRYVSYSIMILFAVATLAIVYKVKLKDAFDAFVKGIKEYEGKGISYCAVCDAFFFRGKDVAVIGDGNYAVHEAEILKPIAKSVRIITNGKSMVQNRNIDVETIKDSVKEVKGKDILEEIEFANGKTIKIDGVFVAEGIATSTDLAKRIGALVEGNNIKINENMETSVRGLYACGDCTGGILQISKAVYEGAKAGLEIIKKEDKNVSN